MRIHILSDLYLATTGLTRGIYFDLIDADVTVLAGDIGVGLQELGFATGFKRPVIYVMGNHEFYGQRGMDKLWRMART